MAYDKLTWVNNKTALSADNFNHIEQGLFDVSAFADELDYKIDHIDLSNLVTLDTEQTLTAGKTIDYTKYKDDEEQYKDVLRIKCHSFSSSQTIDIMKWEINTAGYAFFRITFATPLSFSVSQNGATSSYIFSPDSFGPTDGGYHNVSLGNTNMPWRDFYLVGNIRTDNYSVSVQQLCENRVYRAAIPFYDMSINYVIGLNIGLSIPAPNSTRAITLYDSAGRRVTITISTYGSNYASIDLERSTCEVEHYSTSNFNTVFNSLQKSAIYAPVKINASDASNEYKFVKARYSTSGTMSVITEEFHIYRHCMKIESEYGGNRAYLTFEALLPTNATITVDDLSAIAGQTFMSTGNVMATSGNRTGIMQVTVYADRNCSGINSSNDSFSWYIQSLVDIVTQVF